MTLPSQTAAGQEINLKFYFLLFKNGWMQNFHRHNPALRFSLVRGYADGSFVVHPSNHSRFRLETLFLIRITPRFRLAETALFRITPDSD
jgi:hypothetical protein